MKAIFEPAHLGRLEIKNRLVRSATYEFGAIKDGEILPLLADIYRALARGGAGLIITGTLGVSGESGEMYAKTDAASFPAAFGAAVRAAHENGCRIMAQIGHQGGKAEGIPGGASPLAPSETEAFPSARAMTAADIARVTEDFARAALRCKEAGADAVQIHAGHGYLISEFLSPYCNKREDEYGGSKENRARFLFSVYDAVRAAAGDFPVLVKINWSDLIEGGFSAEDSLWVCGALAERGIDAVEVSGGIAFNGKTSPSQRGFREEGFFASEAARIAAHCAAPVIAMGGFRSPEKITEWLNKGGFEAVSIARPLIREPDLPLRWQTGFAGSAACVSCSKCFRSPVHGCALVNAPAG